MADRETGERRDIFCCFARLARFPRSRDHPEGLLAVYADRHRRSGISAIVGKIWAGRETVKSLIV